MERLGVDDDNQLFWDGRRVEVRRPLYLTVPEKIVAGVVAFFTVLGALGCAVSGFHDAADFLCARGNQALTCPLPVDAPVVAHKAAGGS
jgi:hypothetical protein